MFHLRAVRTEEQDRGPHLASLAAADKTEPFGSCRLDGDAAGLHAEDRSEGFPHPEDMGSEFRRLEGDRNVRIEDAVAGAADKVHDLRKENLAVDALPLRGAVREEVADIPEGKGPEEGEQMTVSDMLKCIAVVSANDCAVAMAEHLSGTEELFVERMNRRAEELGLTNTHFTNCTGLFDDEDHYTSARDIAILSRELMGHAMIRDYTTIWMDSIRDGSFELANTNKLVYWYPGCTGLKTGYTSTARYCLSATAERNGVEYIAVVMHGETADSRNRDAETLLSYGFANYRLIPLSDGAPLPTLPVELGQKKTLSLALDGPAYQVAEKGGEAAYALPLPSSVAAPVKEGQALGTLRVTVGEKLLAEVPVCAAEEVPRIGFGGIFTKLALSLFGI